MFSFIRYRISFRTKLLFSYILLILLPVSMLSGYCVSTMRSFSLSQADNNVEEALQQVSDTISYKLEQSRTAARYIAQNEAVVNALQAVDTSSWERYQTYRDLIDPIIKSAYSINNTIDGIIIYQNNPVLVNHSPSVRTLAELEQYNWLPSVLSYNEYWYIERDMLIMNTRLPGTNAAAPALILQMRLKVKDIFDISFETLEYYVLDIKDANGRILFFRDTLRETDGAYGRWNVPVGGTGWSLNMAVPRDTLTIGTSRFSMAIILVTLFCFVLMLPPAFLLARSQVSRINLLNRHMVEAERGDLSATISIRHSDEIGLLMRHFNDMLLSLKTTLVDLSYTEKRQREAEMRALRAQINPHFLYNTLSLISWKAIDQGADEVVRITGIFSKFCRTVLNRGKSESALAEELTNVKCYVDIQQEMHDHSFKVTYEVADGLLDCIVPNFMLQPIVENAIIHGLDEARDIQGRLKVSVSREDDDIIIRISNNGAVFLQEALNQALGATDAGYGLRNVQERIVYLYGEDYGLFLDKPVDGYTTCVGLRMKVKQYVGQDHRNPA